MESYEEMHRFVRQKFDIEENAEMCLEVNEFDECEKEWARVEVDESAYGYMAPHLHTLHVNVSQRDVGASSSSKGKAKETYSVPTPAASEHSTSNEPEKRSKGSPPTSPIHTQPALPPKSGAPDLSTSGYPEGDGFDEEESGMVDVLPSPKPPPPSEPRVRSPSPPSSVRRDFLTSKKAKSPVATSTPLPESRSSKEKLTPTLLPPVSPFKAPPSPVVPRARSKSRSAAAPVASGSGNNGRDADQLFNDSVTVEENMVLNELTIDPEQEPELEPESERETNGFRFGTQFFDKKKAKDKKQPRDEDIIDVDADEDEIPPPGPSSRSHIKKKVSEPIIEDPQTISRTQPRRAVPKPKRTDDDGESSSNTKSRSKKTGPPSRFASGDETEPPPGTQGPVLNETPAGGEEDNLIQADGRFKIFISGPKRSHRAEFMTKDRHKMKKVLTGACKTFKLDPERSRLELLVVKEDDGGDIYIPCVGEETVGRAGVKPGSELKVVVEDGDELDDEDDYSFN
ncbi:hypothetical protein AAF712_007423 [Marasmius tenuissimus]|uniref:Uncharacterized protein n=1 Tax=Marasmius tenuissimus TaxID=585030 RepID=A0ABR2ZVS7_9AGAR